MKPPFRADHVGSLLRPEALLESREQWKNEALSADDLRRREDAAIAEVVKKQEAIGIKSVTDGEFRRESFHFDFIDRIGGIVTNFTIGRAILQGEKTKQGGEKQVPLTVEIVDRMMRPTGGIEVENFKYLKTQAGPDSTPKVTVPSPTMTHFRGGRDAIDREAYPDMERFLRRSGAPVPRRNRGSGRRRLPLHPVRRHQPGLSVRQQDARGRAGARRRSR